MSSNDHPAPKGPAPKPTADTYDGLQKAYNHFNRKLFGGKLPACMITWRTFGKALGHFSPNRFVNVNSLQVTHEIALDPRRLADRGTEDIMSTLVHEMAHLWQFEHGNPSRNGYHNTEWATKMIEIGLIPSNTGKPGGKQTGQQMDHYIEEGGKFQTVAAEFIDNGKFTVNWADVLGFLAMEPASADVLVGVGGGSVTMPSKPTGSNGKRIKYSCPVCGNNAWGKANMLIGCGGHDDSEHDTIAMIVVGK